MHFQGFDIEQRLMIMSRVGFRPLSTIKLSSPRMAGFKELRCLRSLLSFDLEALDRLAAYYLYASVGVPRRLASNTLLVPRAIPESIIINK